MPRPDPKRIAHMHLHPTAKTAGEVRFIKDRGGDKGEWAWNTPGPSQREIDEDYKFNAKNLKPIALTLRATLMALGHATSGHSMFVKLKSSEVSPDGNLGGKGYIQKITDMRRQFMNAVEALSSISDTLYDEVNAPHWHPASETGGPRERDEVKTIIDDAEEVRSNPEAWAEKEEQEMDAPTQKTARTARRAATASDVETNLHEAYFGRRAS